MNALLNSSGDVNLRPQRLTFSIPSAESETEALTLNPNNTKHTYTKIGNHITTPFSWLRHYSNIRSQTCLDAGSLLPSHIDLSIVHAYSRHLLKHHAPHVAWRDWLRNLGHGPAAQFEIWDMWRYLRAETNGFSTISRTGIPGSLVLNLYCLLFNGDAGAYKTRNYRVSLIDNNHFWGINTCWWYQLLQTREWLGALSYLKNCTVERI